MACGITESFLDSFQLFFEKTCMSFNSDSRNDTFFLNEEIYQELFIAKDMVFKEAKKLLISSNIKRLVDILLNYCDRTVTAVTSFAIRCNTEGFVTGEDFSHQYYPIFSALLSFRYYFDALISGVSGISLVIIHNLVINHNVVAMFNDLDFDEDKPNTVVALLNRYGGMVVVPVIERAKVVIGSKGIDNQFTLGGINDDILEYVITINNNQYQLQRTKVLEIGL